MVIVSIFVMEINGQERLVGNKGSTNSAPKVLEIENEFGITMQVEQSYAITRHFSRCH
jgi:hypothetical protein